MQPHCHVPTAEWQGRAVDVYKSVGRGAGKKTKQQKKAVMAAANERREKAGGRAAQLRRRGVERRSGAACIRMPQTSGAPGLLPVAGLIISHVQRTWQEGMGGEKKGRAIRWRRQNMENEGQWRQGRQDENAGEQAGTSGTADSSVCAGAITQPSLNAKRSRPHPPACGRRRAGQQSRQLRLPQRRCNKTRNKPCGPHGPCFSIFQTTYKQQSCIFASPARNWRMKKPKRGVRSMDPSSGGTRPENSFR